MRCHEWHSFSADRDTQWLFIDLSIRENLSFVHILPVTGWNPRQNKFRHQNVPSCYVCRLINWNTTVTMLEHSAFSSRVTSRPTVPRALFSFWCTECLLEFITAQWCSIPWSNRNHYDSLYQDSKLFYHCRLQMDCPRCSNNAFTRLSKLSSSSSQQPVLLCTSMTSKGINILFLRYIWIARSKKKF